MNFYSLVDSRWRSLNQSPEKHHEHLLSRLWFPTWDPWVNVKREGCVWRLLLWLQAHLMKGLTSVMRALMYQAGWTTSSPFRSFLSLQRDHTSYTL